MPKYDIAARAQALTLHELGYSPQVIAEETRMTSRHVQNIITKAKERGYDPSVSRRIKDEYLVDAMRPSRPPKLSKEQEDALVAASKLDQYAREKSSTQLSAEFGVLE